jgi:hypothetical protein
MTVNLSLLAGAGAQFFTNSGVILSGGLVYTYAAGTTTPQASYTTSSGSVAHTNPIVLDSAGRVPSGGEIWLTDAVSYKFVLQTSLAVLIATYDNITNNGGAFIVPSGSNSVGFIQAGTGAVATTVQTKLREIVSVKDFGAVSDGATNNTTFFATAGAASNYLTVSNGTYNLATTPSMGNTAIEFGANTVLNGAGGTALGYTGFTRKQLLHNGTAGTDFATSYIRRNATHTGGTFGYVSSGLRVDTYVSAPATNFEWAITGVVDSSATAGQNVGVYGQGIKRAAGAVWGMVAEVIDPVGTNNPTTGMVGLEVDCRGNGTDNSNNKLGIDIVVNRQNPVGATNEVGFGVRLQNGGDAGCKVKTGFYIVCAADVGFDCSASPITQAAYKMAQGQGVAFDASALNQVSYDGTGIRYAVSGVIKSRLNADGSIALFGGRTVVGGTFSTGAQTPTIGTNKPGTTGGAPGQWLSVTIDGLQYWVPAWSN